ncbi:alanine racemase [Sphingomonas sp. CL5.1]|uniref:alanine racemase n=1 Tax=Sphingomonas sp. CL5.1 TaxID=2653203 RepID=UPI001582FFCC|nr:alanine racemase [Sphingomonas sp. CL5.1]QKR99070.1 alanine racemase [Sphingomonas sp. CL5.1]
MNRSPCRLSLDAAALVHNWRLLDRMSGTAACGAAVKADGYGLGAREVARRLSDAGCRDFFVATWAEARALVDTGVTVSVFHGLRAEDMALAGLRNARPVLNTPVQVNRWKEAGGGLCDVMVDTGMNRLGVSAGDIAAGLLDGLAIDTLMTHLASADEDTPINHTQRERFAALAGKTQARRMSIANSAGIALGAPYHLDLVRPGLALYGGVPRAELRDIRQVARPEAQVLQRRRVGAGETVGYNATWTALADTEVAIVNLGYADGYWRGFSGKGHALVGEARLPVLGRVSMDLIAVDCGAFDVAESDWLALDYALPQAAAASGMSQYELLTGLGSRFDRIWR